MPLWEHSRRLANEMPGVYFLVGDRGSSRGYSTKCYDIIGTFWLRDRCSLFFIRLHIDTL